MLLASVATIAGCHEPEENGYLMEGIGLNSVTAAFATGDYKTDVSAKFTTTVTEDNIESIVIDVPYYYPESSTTISSMTEMRVTASLDNNYTLSPALSTLDLTEVNYFTLTQPDGSTRSISITGNHKKSDACQILSFTIASEGLTGVIDQTNKTISLMSVDDIENASATVVLSSHASIYPDPTEPRTYSSSTPVEFTVTAFDEETASTYEVILATPSKTAYGWKSGTEKKIWTKTISSDFGFTVNATGQNSTLGVLGNSLIYSTGVAQYEIDIITGESKGELSWSMNLGSNGAITTDSAGNLLLCAAAGSGESTTIYTTSSVDEAPVAFTTVTNLWVSGMGKHISVFGDIKGDAIITIPMWVGWTDTTLYFGRIIVTGGVPGEIECVNYNYQSTVNAWGNTDVVYATTDITSGYYYGVSYSGNNINAAYASSNEYAGSIISSTVTTNNNANCIDAIEFNGATYVAALFGAHFTWSVPVAYMYDVTIPTFPSTSVWSGSLDNPSVVNLVSSDILLTQSSDGFYLYAFFTDSASGTISGYEFNCIDQ